MAERASNVVLNFQTNGQVQYAQTLKQINMVMQTAAKEYTNQIQAMGKDASMTEKLRAEKQKLQTQMSASSEKVRMLREEYEAMQNDTSATAEELQKMYNKLLTAENAHTKLEMAMARVNEGLTDEAIAAREAKNEFKSLGDDAKTLEAEQRRLTSAFALQVAQLDENASEADRAALAQQQHTQQMELAGRAINNLEQQLDAARRAYGENSREVMQLETRLNEARVGLTRFGDELNDVENEAEQASSALDGLGDNFGAVVGGLAAVGGIAGVISKALDVSSLNTKIDITLDVPEESKESVRQAIKGVEAYGVDAEAALEGVRKQWALNKDASDESNAQVIKSAGAIASAYSSIDFGELIQESHEMAKTFGISQEEAIAMTNSLLKVGFPADQLDIIGEYGNQLKMAGYNATEIQAIMAAGVETGTWNIDVLLDGVKEGRIVMAEFGVEVDQSMKDVIAGTDISAEQLQVWGKAVAEGGEGGTKAMQGVAQAIANIDDKTKQNEVGVKVFGTLWEENGTNITDTLLNMGNHMTTTKENQESLNSAVSAMESDPAVQLEQALNDMMTALQPILTDVAEVVAKIADWGSENSKLAATLVAISTVLGVLVGAFALLAPAIAAVIPLLTTGGIAAGALGGALALITGPVGLIVAGLAAVGVGAAVMGKELSESSIQVEDWTDKVSEGTAKAVGGFLDLNTQATAALNELNWSGTAVTQEMANNITGIYSQMGDQVLSEMQADHQAELDTMTQHFANTSSLSQVEEAAILERVATHNAEKEAATKAGTDRINEILNTAAQEKRALTENEQKEINMIQETMKNNAIKYMSESEAEQKAILETLKNEASKISAEQAAEVVKNSKKQKDESVQEADAQYNETVKWAIRQRDETGTMSAEEAQKVIDDAKHKRDQAVKNAEEMHTNVVKEAKSQAKEHVEQVDWETGEVLSKWEVLKNDVASEWKSMWESADKWFSEVGKSVSDNIDDAVNWASDGVDKIKKFFSGLKLKIPKIEMPKMPKFSLETSTKTVFGKEITYPSGLGIEWFAKGGIMTRPTAFGINGNNLMVGGEAGPEAILPLNEKTLGEIGRGVAASIKMPSTIVVQSILDGRVIAESVTPFVSENQYSSSSIAALTKGVSFGCL